MRLLLEAEVVAHAVFDPDVGEAHLSIPERNVELRLKNLDVEMGKEKPLLEALLVFEAESLESGFKTGRRLLKDLLSSLSYITSFKFEYHRARRLIDWSDGTFARQFHVYANFPGHDLPHYVLTPELLNNAGAMWQASKDHPLEVAVHWFASGVKATVLEDQFQLFWFAAELLASHGKDATPVNDLCAVCRTPLYCESCGTHPAHRPYQKQAIEKLIHAFSGEKGEEISERLFKVRNMLLHGSTRNPIELSIDGKLEDCVEEIAQVTKRGIFYLLRGDLANVTEKDRFEMLSLEGYAYMTLGIHTLVSSSSIPPDLNMLDRLAMPKIDLVLSEKPKEDQ